jgi:cytidylate kinase
VSGFVIAIDGPAASGKGAIAHALADAYRLPVLDTGLLYRAVGLAVTRAGGNPDDGALAARHALGLNLSRLDDPALRSLEAGAAASRVAVHPAVREVLRAAQRAFAAQPGGAIIDGRDIGTVIAPDAPAKLYVTASPAARAERRWLQLKTVDPAIGREAVIADIGRRDAVDSGRADSPMRPAADAVLLDTTEMTIEAAADAARRIVEAARARWAKEP